MYNRERRCRVHHTNTKLQTSSIASFLFPLFASYKALQTSDPAQLTPWLMYWVVLACFLVVESWTEWFLVWYTPSPTPGPLLRLPTNPRPSV